MDIQLGQDLAMGEQESGMGSSGGEMNNGSGGEDASSTFWSSSNSNSYDSSGSDLSGMLHVQCITVYSIIMIECISNLYVRYMVYLGLHSKPHKGAQD